MFIQTEATPNPEVLKFLPGREVMGEGTRDFRDAEAGAVSPLAAELFALDGVERVFFGPDFLTVGKTADHEWSHLKAPILAAIMDHFTSGLPLFAGADDAAGGHDEGVYEGETAQIVAEIKDLLDSRIRPAVPQAELHIFAGTATYGAAGAAKAGRMGPVLERAAAMTGQGVILRGPVPKTQLVEELAQARALLYRGDIGETFCSAVAEAQAMGLPIVLEDIACMSERVIEGETGYCVRGQDAFAEAGIRLLTDSDLWRRFHRAALAKQRSWRWEHAAAEFERIGELR